MEQQVSIVVSGGSIHPGELRDALVFARDVGSENDRCVISGVLCGDRSTVHGLKGWRRRLEEVAGILSDVAPVAESMGIHIGVENHQDATSNDLVWLCERVRSSNVGVTLDTGNSLPVWELPLEFAKRVLPYIKNVHLKDYRLFRAEHGVRLVHCPIGAGVVDFHGMFKLLETRPDVPRSIEMAAQAERYVRFLDPAYWAGHEKRDVERVLGFFRLCWRQAGTGDWRTPWEKGESNIGKWEMDCLEESVRGLTHVVRCFESSQACDDVRGHARECNAWQASFETRVRDYTTAEYGGRDRFHDPGFARFILVWPVQRGPAGRSVFLNLRQ